MFSAINAQARPIRIAIIDTGVNQEQVFAPICDNGIHYTTYPEEGSTDINGHGTLVSQVLAKNMPTPLQYCIIPFKVFNSKMDSGPDYVANSINMAVLLKADIINLSLRSPDKLQSEIDAVKNAIESRIIIVAAAGNEGIDLNKKCNSYFACYDSRIIVVGFHSEKSNTGRVVDYVTEGTSVDGKKQGSSFAAPRIVALIASNLETYKENLYGK